MVFKSLTNLLRSAVSTVSEYVRAKTYGDDLIDAVRDGDVLMTEYLLTMGAKFESSLWSGVGEDPFSGESSLYDDIFERTGTRRKILRLLVRHGLDVARVRDEYGNNLLNKYIDHAQTDDKDTIPIVRLLLESGISVNEPNNRGQAPLLESIRAENIQLALFLIRSGADVNLTEKIWGMSPLSSATMISCERLVYLLVFHGADVDYERRLPALHLACCNGSDKIVNFLIRNGADVRLEDFNGETAFRKLMYGADRPDYESSIEVVLQELARLTYKRVPIHESDARLIRQNPKVRTYFDECTAELEQLDELKFYNDYSYLSVLEMSSDVMKLALLMKNPQFAKNFAKNLKKFRCYRKTLRKLMGEAVRVKELLLLIESSLDYLLDYRLPKVVIRRLMKALGTHDPLLRQKSNASNVNYVLHLYEILDPIHEAICKYKFD